MKSRRFLVNLVALAVISAGGSYLHAQVERVGFACCKGWLSGGTCCGNWCEAGIFSCTAGMS